MLPPLIVAENFLFSFTVAVMAICFPMIMIFFQIVGLMLLALEWRTLFPTPRSAS